jgi:serine protease Do
MLRLGSLIFCAAAFLPAQEAAATRTRAQAAAVSRSGLGQLSESIETLARSVNRAVVQIFSTSYSIDNESESGDSKTAGLVTKQRSSGSGIVVGPDGYIVTNYHVVKNTRRVRVQFTSSDDSAPGAAGEPGAGIHAHGKLLDAKVVGFDREADLAVIKVEPPSPLTVLKLADSGRLRQGQLVLAFGNPLGLENSVSMGVVSSVGRQIRPDDPNVYIQTDASINPGNSGGPLLNVDGEVVGINTFIFSQSGGSEGIGFAIPSNVVAIAYQQIRQDGHVHRGEIGVTPQSITPELAAGLGLKQDWGVILGDVEPDGPAAQGGVAVGDIVVSLDGKNMENARQFQVALYRIPLNQTVNLDVLRDGMPLSMRVKVTERDDDPFRFVDLVKPQDNLIPKLGIVGIPITDEVAKLLPDTRKKYGVIVAAREGEAEYTGQGGLKLGDVIYAVNTTPVSTLDAVRQAVADLKNADPLVLQIERDGKLMYLTLSEE